MGRMLGAHDSEELDRPDLNKCPDCGCYFAGDACPLCGKICPEEMRAGNRKSVKKTKTKRGGSGRVTFVEWYHSWWFIILMMFLFPVVGIVLLLTSPHKKSVKIAVVAVAALYLVLSTFGIGNIVHKLTTLWDKPIDTSLSREEYIDACTETSAENFYRDPDSYDGKFVTMTLTVSEKIIDSDGYYYGDDYITYYVCTSEDGGEFEIMLRDCRQDSSQNLISGDIITVYGEGAGECTVYDMDYEAHTAPCIYVAYLKSGK